MDKGVFANATTDLYGDNMNDMFAFSTADQNRNSISLTSGRELLMNQGRQAYTKRTNPGDRDNIFSQ